MRSLYAHLGEMKVGEGQEVRRRQLIGTVGQDPEKLFNAHLHLELRRAPHHTRAGSFHRLGLGAARPDA